MSDLSAAIARVRAYIAGESSVILPGDIPAVCAAAERAAAQEPPAQAEPQGEATAARTIAEIRLHEALRAIRDNIYVSASTLRRMAAEAIAGATLARNQPQEGDLLHTMMEWARTEEGRKQLADSYRPHLWACAKRVADPQNEAATCRHWCGDIEHCQPIASAPAQAEPQPAPTPNPGPIGSSLGVAAPDVAALVERLNDVLRNWTNVSDDEQSLIRDARAALTAQQARIDALADSDKYDGDRNELHEVAIAAARLALEHAAQVCHCYAVDQRIHSLAGKGAIHCRDAIRAEAAKIGADA